MTLNSAGLFILVSLVLLFLVRLAGDLLNLTRLKGEPPAEFRDALDADAHDKTLAYTRARLVFGMWSSAWDLALLLAFWALGGFAAWDETVRGWGLGPVAAGVVFIGGLGFAAELLSLPRQVYSTFVLEARFGFNRTTPATFIADRLKGWALAALLGGALLAAVLWLLGRAGGSAWLWAWGVTAAFGLLLQFIAPTWIMPLFNKFTPLPEGALRTAIFDLARRVEYPLSNVFVMDGSKRSSKTNAFFTGFGKNKRIALFDTLVKRHTVPELTAVMAHEIGHYKEGHVKTGAALTILQQGAMFYLLSWALRSEALFAAFGVAPSAYAGLVFFGFLCRPVSFVLGLALTALSRRHEFQADRYALRVMGDAAPMVGALKKLAASNLAQLTPHPFYVFLHYTHPPLPARVAALRRAQ